MEKSASWVDSRLLVLWIALAMLTWGCGNATTDPDRYTAVGQSLQEKSQTVVIGINRLFPGQFQFRHVTIEDRPDRYNHRLMGDFTVSDGYTIEAFLMLRSDVAGIVAGEEIERIWRTGIRQSAAWEVGIPIAGKFTFVLDNRVGEKEWKSVTSNVVLPWDQF